MLAIAHFLLATAAPCVAEEFHNALSLQGFTGLLNTPNAAVTDEGNAYLFYSNQKESKWRDRSYENSYMFSLGLFSFAEVGGRVTDTPGEGAHDLSGNVKLSLPFSRGAYFLPDVAFGMQDIGGGAKNLQTKYAVVTKELWRLRFSLGYGAGPDRMDGVFGGVEMKAFDWLYLIGEHDTQDKNVGIRLVTPSLFGLPVNLQATAKTSLDYKAGNIEYGIGLQFPLGIGDRKESRPEEARDGEEGEKEKEDGAERSGAEGAAETRVSDGASRGARAAAAPVPALETASGAEKAAAAPAPGMASGTTAAPGLRMASGETTAPTAGTLAGRAAPASGTATTSPGMAPGAAAQALAPPSGDGGMESLRERLVADGFQNVRIGTDPDKKWLVVEYENVRYNYNELDGLGVVVGLVVETVSPDFELVQLVMVKKGIRMLQVTAPLVNFRAFAENADAAANLYAFLEISPKVVVDPGVRFISGDANASWLTSELILHPWLKTYVATEVGIFDYLLSVKPDYYLNLWKGAVLNARWDIPVDWSENFDDGKEFRNNRQSSQFDRLMLFQALKLTPALMVNFGAGMVLHKNYGTINELLWTPGSGNHRFSLKQVYLAGDEKNRSVPYPSNQAYLASYRYYLRPLDLYLLGTAGQFLDEDRGFKLEMKRFFGDTAVSLYYKNSRTESRPNFPSEDVQMGGIQISIPLTLRRDMKPIASVQVKGANEWTYVQETKIVTPGSANFVDTSIGLDPQTPYNLQHIYYNRDRLTEDYIRKHLLRLRK